MRKMVAERALLATALCLLLLLSSGGTHMLREAHAAGYPGASNRDVDGAIVVDGSSNYVPNAAACASQCQNTTGCNLWVWCGHGDGCMSNQGSYDRDLTKFRQCWLKYDSATRPGFPSWKNDRSRPTGFISGTTAAIRDSAGSDTTYNSCKCKASWVASTNGVVQTFQGVCANAGSSDGQTVCDIDPASCTTTQKPFQNCPTPQSCNVTVGVDFDGALLVSGEQNYVQSAEDCCAQCAKTQNCQVWVWCSDAGGCGSGGLRTWRQCWLKSGDPRAPKPKPNAHPGWISGVRMAYL